MNNLVRKIKVPDSPKGVNVSDKVVAAFKIVEILLLAFVILMVNVYCAYNMPQSRISVSEIIMLTVVLFVLGAADLVLVFFISKNFKTALKYAAKMILPFVGFLFGM